MKSRAMYSLLTATAVALIAGLALLGSYFFHTEVSFVEGVGNVSETYRWGRLTWVSVDANRDGKEDARARFELGLERNPVEQWEDRDSDGVFEVYIRYSGGEVVYLDLDVDGDGVRERRLTGDAIDRFFLKKPGPRL